MPRALIIGAVLALTTPAFAARGIPVGWDTCDELEATEGGTASATTITATARTGRCGLRVTVGNGVDGFHGRAITSDMDTYGRTYLRPLGTSTSEGRVGFGAWQGGTSGYGCRADAETDGAVSLHFKDRTSYQELWRGAAGLLVAGTWTGVEVHQANLSAEPCASDCVVTCELWVDGFRVAASTLTSVEGADYDPVTEWRIGAADSGAGAYDLAFDDFVPDDTTRIGIGSVLPIAPSANGTNVAWSNGGNVGNCAGGASRFGCVDEFASGTAAHDVDDSYLETSGSGDLYDAALADITLVAGATVPAVTVLALGREQTDGTRNFRVNLFDGTNTIAGTTFETTTSYTLGAVQLSAVAPDGSAWSESDVDGLIAQFEKTSSATNRVTAVLAYVDVHESDPIATQNNQDWDDDGRLTYCHIGDSRTQGTGLGYCQGDVSETCSDSADCAPPLQPSDIGPCANTSKVSNVFAGLATQTMGGTTTVLNGGIAGNITEQLLQRIPQMLSGVGGVGNRWCRSGLFGAPVQCTPDDPTCTATTCTSSSCFTGSCDLSTALTLGTKLCSNDHGVECADNGDCAGGGTCTDLPGCDYFYILIGVNDLHQSHNPECGTGLCAGGTNVDAACVVASECPGGTCRPGPYAVPCPVAAAPASSATPAKTPAPTPTPGTYQCRQATCTTATECTTGRCTNDVAQACDGDGDCGSGACSSALAPPGLADCIFGLCTCPCASVPCTSNAHCGPGYYYDATGLQTTLPQYGTCIIPPGETIGHCANCGPAGCPTDGYSRDHYEAFRRYRNPVDRIELLQQIETMIEGAGRRVIWLTDPPIHQPCEAMPEGWTLNNGWSGVLDASLAIRAQFYLDDQRNTVDLWHILPTRDFVRANYRCNNDAHRTCATNADCSGIGAACVAYPSTMRPAPDPIHLNGNGASHTGSLTYDYSRRLSPVCTGDPATGCGRCSVTTATACVDSDACPEGEKCVYTDSVCSGAGKGLCRLERACNSTSSCVLHHRCTRDLTVVCDEDSDCTGNGVCRPEGLPAVGEG